MGVLATEQKDGNSPFKETGGAVPLAAPYHPDDAVNLSAASVVSDEHLHRRAIGSNNRAGVAHVQWLGFVYTGGWRCAAVGAEGSVVCSSRPSRMI